MSSLRSRFGSLLKKRSRPEKQPQQIQPHSAVPPEAAQTAAAIAVTDSIRSSAPAVQPEPTQLEPATQPAEAAIPAQPAEPVKSAEPVKPTEPASATESALVVEPVPLSQQSPLQQPHHVYDRASVLPTAQAASVTGTLQVQLQNQSNSDQVYAYITGLAIDNNNAVFLLKSDARTPYYPPSPSHTGASLGANVSIALGAPGNTVTATIPRLAGARIWFSIGKPLVFLLNPGPGLVEPSVFNPADPNYNTNFSFAEFTFNSAQVFVNISYVDFVSNAPIALTLYDTAGRNQHVSGMRANGLETVCAGLRAQTAKDGRRWGSLIVEENGQNLRALSPNSGITTHGDWFQTYYTDYINEVWAKYHSNALTVDTQASYGAVQGRINGAGQLDFGNGSVFSKPTSADIFSNSTGPFATGGNAKTNAIIPRLAAAFNRSTLLDGHQTPNGIYAHRYYTNATTNHYARIVHSANVDGLGYAFPYDDVTPNTGHPQEGAIFSYAPTTLVVAVGGNNAHV